MRAVLAGQGHGGGLLEREVGRLGASAPPSGTRDVFGERAASISPNTSSPGREAGHPRADGLDPARRSRVPRTRTFGAPSPKAIRATYGSPRMTCQSRALTEAAWTRTSTSPAAATGAVDLAEPQHVGRAVAVLDDRLHRSSPCDASGWCTAYTCCARTVRCTSYTSQGEIRVGARGRLAQQVDAPRRAPLTRDRVLRAAVDARRRGGDRRAQHAQARAGARRRADGALQARRQQGGAPRRHGRRRRRRDRPAGRRRRLADAPSGSGSSPPGGRCCATRGRRGCIESRTAPDAGGPGSTWTR